MSEPEKTNELRWFIDEPLDDQLRGWFRGIQGPIDEAKPRADLYLIPRGNGSDLSVKLREGKLELKRRQADSAFARAVGRTQITGRSEVWLKWTWKYCKNLASQVDGAFAESDLPGSRREVAKIRWQRKYEVTSPGQLKPVAAKERLDRYVAIELTDLKLDGRLAWSLGLDVVTPEGDIDKIFTAAVETLLGKCPATGKLIETSSFGYPAWLLR